MALDDLMLELMERTREAFGRAICDLLDGRGLSLRQARTRTGVDIDTLSRMRAGEVVRMDKIIQFARGFGLNPSDWLELAGYERLDGVGEGGRVAEERGPLSNAERLAALIEEISRTHPGAEELTVRLCGGLGRLHELTAEEMDALEASIRRNVSEMLGEEPDNE